MHFNFGISTKKRQYRQGLGRLRRFASDESGVLIVFALLMFVLMLMVGGIGVDLMRYERERTLLQNTLDRAVLAAADLDQIQNPEFVVQDYFDKADLGDYLTNVQVDQGLSYRVVTGEASGTFDTQFMHMTGVKKLTAPALSIAEERTDELEISLVLDVSGSMNSNSKLANLKVAAKDFVDNMVDTSDDGKLSISIVPYATQVATPDWFLSKYSATSEHSYSNCVNFQTDDFASTALSQAQELQRTMHFDPWRDFDGRDNDPVELVRSPVCEDDPSREMMILQKDRMKLKNYIDGFWGGGNTSIDVAMKWGAALLDPSTRPVIQDLIIEGHVPAGFGSRPHEFTSRDALKVIVLMTDGMNTSQYYVRDGYREGDSNIWWNDQEEVYSVYVGLDEDDQDGDSITEEPLFYWPMDGSWKDHAYGEGTYDETVETRECTSFRRNGSCRSYDTVATTVTVDEPGSAELLSYPDLWAYTTLERNVEQNYEPWMDNNQAWNDWYYDVRDFVPAGTKDSRLKSICGAVKAQQVIVFTIGFEAPTDSETLLRECASSPAHYFDVDGLEISNAFAAIASSIRQLRLTQ